MIKKITDKEYSGRNGKYILMVWIGLFFFVLAMFSMMELMPFECNYLLLVLGIYGLPVAIAGIILGSELEEQKEHPEKFIYCKKCRKIIKKKHMFCYSCKIDIKREMERKESIKYIQDYKKFYKGKKK